MIGNPWSSTPRGPAGADGAQGVAGNPGVWKNNPGFAQPAVSGTVNTRWDGAFLTPEVGMVLAGAPGRYQVTSDLGGGIYQLTCLEIRGVAQGASVPVGTVFGQAGGP